MHREVKTEMYEAFAGSALQETRVMITSAMVADAEDNTDLDRRLVLATNYISLTRQEAIEVVQSLVALLTKQEEKSIILAGPSSLVLGANPTLESVDA